MAVINLVVIVYVTAYCVFSGVWALAGLVLLQGVLIWIIEAKSNLIDDLMKLAKEQEITMMQQNELLKVLDMKLKETK